MDRTLNLTLPERRVLLGALVTAAEVYTKARQEEAAIECQLLAHDVIDMSLRRLGEFSSLQKQNCGEGGKSEE